MCSPDFSAALRVIDNGTRPTVSQTRSMFRPRTVLGHQTGKAVCLGGAPQARHRMVESCGVPLMTEVIRDH